MRYTSQDWHKMVPAQGCNNDKQLDKYRYDPMESRSESIMCRKPTCSLSKSKSLALVNPCCASRVSTMQKVDSCMASVIGKLQCADPAKTAARSQTLTPMLARLVSYLANLDVRIRTAWTIDRGELTTPTYPEDAGYKFKQKWKHSPLARHRHAHVQNCQNSLTLTRPGSENV